MQYAIGIRHPARTSTPKLPSGRNLKCHIRETAKICPFVEFREGDALKTLSLDLPETIDLLLLDGAKALYPDILSLIESRLRPSALVVADDADHSPDYLARVRVPANGYMSVPFAEDVQLSMRSG
jgi:predicted O-methyltransferase YrrM